MKEFLNAIEALFSKWLGVDPTTVVVLLLLPLGLIYLRQKYYQDVLKSGGGLAGVRERRAAYFGHLRRALAWVDKGLGRSAWSAASYELALKLTFIYPLASLLLVWFATGRNTSGINELLPDNTAAPKDRLLLPCCATGGSPNHDSLAA